MNNLRVSTPTHAGANQNQKNMKTLIDLIFRLCGSKMILHDLAEVHSLLQAIIIFQSNRLT